MKGRSHTASTNQRRPAIIILVFAVALVALTVAGILLLPKLSSGGSGVGVVTIFRNEVGEFPVTFQKAASNDLLYTCFTSEMTLEEMAQAINGTTGADYEVTRYSGENGGASLFIRSRSGDGTLNYYFIRDFGNGVFLVRYEGIWNGIAGGDEVLFPNHLADIPAWATDCSVETLTAKLRAGPTADGILRFEYGVEYPTTGTLAEFYAYYAASGRYLLLLTENSIRIEGYTAAAPMVVCEQLTALNSSRRGATSSSGYIYYDVPLFQGPYEITVTEAPEGNTFRIVRG